MPPPLELCAGGSPAPHALPPRAAPRRPYAGGATASTIRRAGSVTHCHLFARWRCSRSALCFALPALVHRGFTFGRCRRCRSSTIAVRSSLSALPRGLLLLLRCVRAPWARGGLGSAGNHPLPAYVRYASDASRKRAAPSPPPCGGATRGEIRALRSRAPPSSARRAQPVARWITFASL